MALKSVLEDLEGLDQSLHEHYTEKDGKFYLDIEDDIRAHPKGRSLQAIIDRMKQEKKTLTEKLTEVEHKLADLPEDFDPEKYAEERDELNRLRAKQNDDDPDDESRRQELKRLYDQRIQNLETKYSNDKAALEHERDDLVREIERLIGDEGLTKALVGVGVEKKLLGGATALLRRHVKVERDPESNEWEAFIETDVGRSSIDDYVTSWAQTDGESYIAKAEGGGAKGQNGQRVGENPWRVEEGQRPNLTRQQEFIRLNPDKARQLAQAAGVQPNW